MARPFPLLAVIGHRKSLDKSWPTICPVGVNLFPSSLRFNKPIVTLRIAASDQLTRDDLTKLRELMKLSEPLSLEGGQEVVLILPTSIERV